MPKLFPIHIEVEELAVGKVMRLLNKMPGVARFNLDMDREIKSNGHREPRKARAPYKQFEQTGSEAIAEALYARPDRKGLTTAQLREVFITQGRSGASINSQLSDMKADGEVKNTPDGWILTKKARDRVRARKTYKKARK